MKRPNGRCRKTARPVPGRTVTQYTAQKMPLPAAFFVEAPCFAAPLPSGDGCTAVSRTSREMDFLI